MEGHLPYLSNRKGVFERHRATKQAGQEFMFFNSLEREAGVVVHVAVRTGALRDGWNATVVNHGASRATHCSTALARLVKLTL